MLIRSQDKENIINLGQVTQIHINDYPVGGRGFRIMTNGCAIGDYSEKEKAVKVLDMLCTAYQYAEECKYLEVGYMQPEFVSQMPQDGEM